MWYVWITCVNNFTVTIHFFHHCDVSGLNWYFDGIFTPLALLIETLAENKSNCINEKYIIFSWHWLSIMWTGIIKATAEIKMFSSIVTYIQIFTHCYIAIWYSWVPSRWGLWIKVGEEVRKFWINKWEGWKNIENLIAGMGKINRIQWSWSVLSCYHPLKH